MKNTEVILSGKGAITMVALGEKREQLTPTCHQRFSVLCSHLMQATLSWVLVVCVRV